MKPLKIGCVGCGNISGQYLSMGQRFPIVEIVACADLERDKAEAAARQHGIARVMTPAELLRDPEIEVVLNLTNPKAHVPVSLAALEAGKHVYVEKPLAIGRDEGWLLLEAQRRTALRVACAPDTFLGAGHQAARRLIDDGELGRVTAFTAFMISRGHEHWHPAPAFYYEPGGGPMFDMGPYYLTALLQMLGPIRRVTGFASVAIPEREITSQPLIGTRLKVETPDHYAGVIEFASGVVGSVIQSFAMRNADADGEHPIVVYGTKATLKVPDPNAFDGTPLIRREGGDGTWEPVQHGFVTGYGRGVGLVDLAFAVRTGRAHRCSLEQAFCVLDAMQGFRDASETGQARLIEMPYQRPTEMPSYRPFGELEA